MNVLYYPAWMRRKHGANMPNLGASASSFNRLSISFGDKIILCMSVNEKHNFIVP